MLERPTEQLLCGVLLNWLGSVSSCLESDCVFWEEYCRGGDTFSLKPIRWPVAFIAPFPMLSVQVVSARFPCLPIVKFLSVSETNDYFVSRYVEAKYISGSSSHFQLLMYLVLNRFLVFSNVI